MLNLKGYLQPEACRTLSEENREYRPKQRKNVGRMERIGWLERGSGKMSKQPKPFEYKGKMVEVAGIAHTRSYCIDLLDFLISWLDFFRGISVGVPFLSNLLFLFHNITQNIKKGKQSPPLALKVGHGFDS